MYKFIALTTSSAKKTLSEQRLNQILGLYRRQVNQKIANYHDQNKEREQLFSDLSKALINTKNNTPGFHLKNTCELEKLHYLCLAPIKDISVFICTTLKNEDASKIFLSTFEDVWEKLNAKYNNNDTYSQWSGGVLKETADERELQKKCILLSRQRKNTEADYAQQLAEFQKIDETQFLELLPLNLKGRKELQSARWTDLDLKLNSKTFHCFSGSTLTWIRESFLTDQQAVLDARGIASKLVEQINKESDIYQREVLFRALFYVIQYELSEDTLSITHDGVSQLNQSDVEALKPIGLMLYKQGILTELHGRLNELGIPEKLRESSEEILDVIFEAMNSLDFIVEDTAFDGSLTSQLTLYNSFKTYMENIFLMVDLQHHRQGDFTTETILNQELKLNDINISAQEFLYFSISQMLHSRLINNPVNDFFNPFDYTQLLREICDETRKFPNNGFLINLMIKLVEYAECASSGEVKLLSRYLLKNNLTEYQYNNNLKPLFRQFAINAYQEGLENRVWKRIFPPSILDNPEKFLTFSKSFVLLKNENTALQKFFDLKPLEEDYKYLKNDLMQSQPSEWLSVLIDWEENELVTNILLSNITDIRILERLPSTTKAYVPQFLRTIQYDASELQEHCDELDKSLSLLPEDKQREVALARNMLLDIQYVKDLIIENDLTDQKALPISHWKTVFYHLFNKRIPLPIYHLQCLLLAQSTHAQDVMEAISQSKVDDVPKAINNLLFKIILETVKGGRSLESQIHGLLNRLPEFCVANIYIALVQNRDYAMSEFMFSDLLISLEKVKDEPLESLFKLPILYWRNEVKKIKWRTYFNWGSSAKDDVILNVLEHIDFHFGDPTEVLKRLINKLQLTLAEVLEVLEKFRDRTWIFNAEKLITFIDQKHNVISQLNFYNLKTAFNLEIAKQSRQWFEITDSPDRSVDDLVKLMISQGQDPVVLEVCRERVHLIRDCYRSISQLSDDQVIAAIKQQASTLKKMHKSQVMNSELLNQLWENFRKNNLFNLPEQDDSSVKNMEYLFSINAVAAIMKVIHTLSKDKNIVLRDSQLLSVQLYIYSKSNPKGMLLEIGTGEGKSLSGITYALYLALLGENVDMHTSLEDLAIRGAKDFVELGEKFRIGVSNICDTAAKLETSERTRRYENCQIIYGQTSDFQQDYVKGKFCSENIRGNRRMSYAIVDEADNEMQDNGGHVLYLSEIIPDYYHFDPVFVYLWSTVNGQNIIKLLEEGESDQARELVKDIMNIYFSSRIIVLPRRIRAKYNQRIEDWISSAFAALGFVQQDQEYVLSSAPGVHAQANITVIDENTGQEQHNMHWEKGLHQELQLKHRKPLSPERLKSIFVSNIHWFKHYGGQCLVGMTGTLGSSAEQNSMMEIYELDTFKIPRSKPDLFHIEKGVVCETEEEQLEAIYKSIKDREGRPVLLFCRSIKQVKNVVDYLSKKLLNERVILQYTLSSKETLTTKLENNYLMISTNLSGRGADFKVKKPLHVILTFIQTNSRTETQAFRRAARKGQPGSGQYIVVDPSKTPLAEQLLQRDSQEVENGIQFSRDQIKNNVEGKLIDLFNKLQKDVKETLEEALSKDIKNKDLAKRIVTLQLKHLGYLWAEWLEEQGEDISKSPEGKLVTYEQDFQSFKDRMTALSKSDDMFKFLDGFGEGIVALGLQYHQDHQYSLAIKCYERVIEIEPDFAYSAHYYCAGAKVNRGVKTLAERVEVKQHLKKAEQLVKEQITYALSMKNVLDSVCRTQLEKGKGQEADDSKTFYSNRVDLLNKHLTSISDAIGKEIDSEMFEHSLLVSNPYSELTKEHIKSSLTTTQNIETLLSKEGLIRPLRFSKKCYITDDNKIYREEAVGRRQIGLSTFFFIIDKTELYIKIRKKLSSEDKQITPDFLKGVLFGKEDLKRELLEKKLIDRVKNEDGIVYKINPQLLSSTTPEKIIEEDALLRTLSPINKEELLAVFLKPSFTVEDLPGRFQTFQEAYRNFIEQCLGQSLIKPPKTNMSLAPCEAKSIGKRIQKAVEYYFILGKEDPFYGLENKAVKVIKSHLNELVKERKEKQEQATKAKEKLGHKVTSEESKAIKDYNLKESKAVEEYTLQIISALKSSAGILKTTKSLDSSLKAIHELYKPEDLPEEVQELQIKSFELVLKIDECRSWFDPRAAIVAFFGVLQIVAGLAVIGFSMGALTPIGLALVGEGVNDIIYAIIAGYSGTFSWSMYGICKAVSIAVSAGSLGLGMLIANPASTSAAKTAVQIGKDTAIDATTYATVQGAKHGAEQVAHSLKNASQFLLSIGKAAKPLLIRTSIQVATAAAGEATDWMLTNLIKQIEGSVILSLQDNLKSSTDMTELKNTLTYFFLSQKGKNLTQESLLELEKEVMMEFNSDDILSQVTSWVEGITNVSHSVLASTMKAVKTNNTLRIAELSTRMAGHIIGAGKFGVEVRRLSNLSNNIVSRYTMLLTKKYGEEIEAERTKQSKLPSEDSDYVKSASERCKVFSDSISKFVKVQLSNGGLKKSFKSSVSGLVSEGFAQLDSIESQDHKSKKGHRHLHHSHSKVAKHSSARHTNFFSDGLRKRRHIAKRFEPVHTSGSTILNELNSVKSSFENALKQKQAMYAEWKKRILMKSSLFKANDKKRFEETVNQQQEQEAIDNARIERLKHFSEIQKFYQDEESKWIEHCLKDGTDNNWVRFRRALLLDQNSKLKQA